MGGDLRLLGRMLQLNLQGAMEYRASFLLHMTFMALNNAVYLCFWWLFFDQFGDVEGWRLDHVLRLFAVVAVSFGISHVLFGNLRNLSRLIGEGQLDMVLSQPRDPLLKLLASRTSAASFGDLSFGVLLYAGVCSRGPRDMALFLVVSALSAMVLVSCGVLIHSMAFVLGRSEGISGTLDEALLTFSLYPEGLFSGGVKVLLFTLVPAGLVSYLPVRLLDRPDGAWLLGYALVALTMAAAARAVFRRGLRGYESGNQMVTNV